jgi:hypothetical protein
MEWTILKQGLAVIMPRIAYLISLIKLVVLITEIRGSNYRAIRKKSYEEFFFISLKIMRSVLFYGLLFISVIARAQDKIYFLDGSSKTGKVLEISSEQITMQTSQEPEVFLKSSVLLIEFKNGGIEPINTPTRTVIYNAATIMPSVERTPRARQEIDLFNYNLGSLNTLALCNADVSGFYERLLPGKQFGVGLMAAYNFNVYATASNLFIAVLNNAKKKYDLGAYINFYPTAFEKRTTFYYGLLFKYMNFTFTKVTEEPVPAGSGLSPTLKYEPAEGSQLATIFTCGTHSIIKNKFFIKTIFGLGGFNLRGEYRQQYNYYLNNLSKQQNNNSTNTTAYNRRFLLKFYFGVNMGFSF